MIMNSMFVLMYSCIVCKLNRSGYKSLSCSFESLIDVMFMGDVFFIVMCVYKWKCWYLFWINIIIF